MSEIDPWALPQGGATTANAGIPGTAPQLAFQPIAPLSKTLPIVAMVFGALYVLICLVEIFVLNNRVSFLGSVDITNPAPDQYNQLLSDGRAIKDVASATGLAFWGVLIAMFFWQRSLLRALGSLGARQAVFKRAGYQYFGFAWLISIVLSIVMSVVSKSSSLSSSQDLINHDHEYMVYYGLRAALGVVLVYFAYRMKKISEEGVALLGGSHL